MNRIYYHQYRSPIGPLHIFMDEEGRLIQLHTHSSFISGKAVEIDNSTGNCKPVIKQLDAYFAGSLRQFNIELNPGGTIFQQSVWKAIQEVPYGDTHSYKWVAEISGHPKAFQAVGTAIGANKIIIVIPCHRIIKSSGELGGFACGVDNKKFLLNCEK